MYEYEIIRHPLRAEEDQLAADYHDIIRERAQVGWRLVQIFAPPLPPDSSYLELIFERPVQLQDAQQGKQG